VKILVIEDNEAAAQSLGVILHMRWPDAIVIDANTGTKGIDLFCTNNPDLVILDLGLPDIDGFDVLKEIRTISNTPIIIVTARSTHDNIIRGLELGADDYIVKPYDYLECLARVQALIRRLHVSVQGQPMVCGQFRLDNDMRSLYVNDRQTNLTHTEGVILRELIRNVGRSVSMENLCNQIWGSTYPGAQDSIRVYIRRIREKIENNPNHPIFIITKPGIGYYLSEVVKKDSLE
jgi:two-component system KDP operon response regulator KdpE